MRLGCVCAVWICLLAVATASNAAQAPKTAVLVAKALVAQPGPYYVGQAIELRVSVIAGGERPTLVPPRLDHADLVATGTRLRQLDSSAIGRAVSETIQYIYNYRLIARQSGTLSIPPFVARQGGRTGATLPLTIEVVAAPLAGQRASFLGGVGELAVEASVEPPRVRVGETSEYRVAIRGPAARGSVRRLDIDGPMNRASLPIVVTSLPDEQVDDPPSKTYRFRLRPMQAGSWVLPAVSISSFDPETARYMTHATTGVPLVAVAVPDFDPATLGPEPSIGRRGRGARLWALSAAILVAGVVGSLGLVVWRWQRSRPANLAHLAARLARELTACGLGDETAKQINAAFVSLLRRAAGRPPGVLTPVEAAHAFSQLMGDDELGRRAQEILGGCDRVLFSAHATDDGSLASEAAALLYEMGARLALLQKHRERQT
jgi:hypothetical protein